MNRKMILICSLCIMTLLLGAPTRGEGPTGNIAVIASTAWEDASIIDREELKVIFLGKKGNFMGKRVKPLQRRSGMPIRKGFIRNVLMMNERELKAYWISEQIKGGSIPPRSSERIDAVVGYVSSVDGAISYVDPGELTPEHLKKVKVINIKESGRVMNPSDPGYILKY